nr:MAG TPA: hypothetical protein [Caudoviricetes sp.]
MRHTNSGAKKKSENLDLASLSNRLWDKGSCYSPQSLLYHKRGIKSWKF